MPGGGRLLLASSPQQSVGALVASLPASGLSEVALLTLLDVPNWPEALASWRVGRVIVAWFPAPVMQPDTAPWPAGRGLIDERWFAMGDTLLAPNGKRWPVDNLGAALTTEAHGEHLDLVFMGERTVQQLIDQCLAAQDVMAEGVRCVVATGDPLAWERWRSSPVAPEPEPGVTDLHSDLLVEPE
jgi:hypothetical protein